MMKIIIDMICVNYSRVNSISDISDIVQFLKGAYSLPYVSNKSVEQTILDLISDGYKFGYYLADANCPNLPTSNEYIILHLVAYGGGHIRVFALRYGDTQIFTRILNSAGSYLTNWKQIIEHNGLG